MSAEEVRDPALSAILARKVARIHGLRAPINKERDWLTKMFKRYHSQIVGLCRRPSVAEKDRPLAEPLLAFDFDWEIQWLM